MNIIEHNCGKVRRVQLETSSRPMLASTQRLHEYEMMLKTSTVTNSCEVKS